MAEWLLQSFGWRHVLVRFTFSTQSGRPPRVLSVFLVTILFAPGTHRSEFDHLRSRAWRQEAKEATHTVSWLKRPTIINYPTQPTQNDTKRINKFQKFRKKTPERCQNEIVSCQNDVRTAAPVGLGRIRRCCQGQLRLDRCQASAVRVRFLDKFQIPTMRDITGQMLITFESDAELTTKLATCNL